MSSNALKLLHAKTSAALTELGCKVTPVIDGDELILRDILVFLDEGEFVVLEAAKEDSPLLRLSSSQVDDVAAAICLQLCRGIITRAISGH